MFYLFWIPTTIILYILIGWLSVRVNVSDNRMWYVSLVVIQMIPFWTVVARFSKNITIDSMLYDVLIFLTSLLSIGIFSGQLVQFGILQYIGLIMVILGFVCLQIKL